MSVVIVDFSLSQWASRVTGWGDDPWERIEEFLPGRSGSIGHPGMDNRLFIEAVLYRYRAGIQWRKLPKRFGELPRVLRIMRSSVPCETSDLSAGMASPLDIAKKLLLLLCNVQRRVRAALGLIAPNRCRISTADQFHQPKSHYHARLGRADFGGSNSHRSVSGSSRIGDKPELTFSWR